MSVPPDPVARALQLRAELERIDAATLRRTLLALSFARRRIDQSIAALLEALGDPETALTSNALSLATRAETLRQIEAALNRAGLQLEPALIRAREQAVEAALTAAEEIAQAQGFSLQDGLDTARRWTRLDESAVKELVETMQDGRPMSRWIRQFGPETRQAIEETIERAVTEHANVGDLGRELAKQADLAERRALLVTRESTFGVQRRAADESFKQNRRILRGKMRIEKLDEKTCRTCVALNGVIYPVDQIIPTHVGCRMTPAPVVRGGIGIQEIENGDEWLAQQSELHQRTVIGSEAGYDAWKAGEVQLADFTEVYETEWGPQTRIVGAERAKANAAKRRAS